MNKKPRTTKELTIQLMQLLVEATLRGVILIEGREVLNRLNIGCGNISSFLNADDRVLKMTELLGWSAVTESEGKCNHVYLIYKFNKKLWKAYRKAIIEESPRVWAKPRTFSSQRLIEYVIRVLKAPDAPDFKLATEALKEIGCSTIPTNSLMTYSSFKETLNACQISMQKNAQGRWVFTLTEDGAKVAAV